MFNNKGRNPEITVMLTRVVRTSSTRIFYFVNNKDMKNPDSQW